MRSRIRNSRLVCAKEVVEAAEAVGVAGGAAAALVVVAAAAAAYVRTFEDVKNENCK